LRLILIAVAVVVIAVGGLMFYGYSWTPAQKQVHVEIPNDQFPQ